MGCGVVDLQIQEGLFLSRNSIFGDEMLPMPVCVLMLPL